MRRIKTFILTIVFIFLTFSIANSDVIKEIKIEGNNRISDEIIKIFSDIKLEQDLQTSDINKIIKNLYETKFFNNISVNFENNIISIIVEEAPLIDKVTLSGIKAKKIEENIRDILKLKQKSSFDEFQMLKDVENIESTLKSIGYYFAKVSPSIEKINNNMVNLEYQIELGNKAKIKKISFLGNEVFKDKKLKSIIISEEYKFWKFISGKKYLQVVEKFLFKSRLLQCKN